MSGAWKNKPLPTLQTELRKAVCLAVARWQLESEVSSEQRDDEDRVGPCKKARLAAATDNAGGQPMEPPAKKLRTAQAAADDEAAKHVDSLADGKGTEQQETDGMPNTEPDT